MRNCIICRPTGKKYSYHTFPKNETMKMKWLKAFNLELFEISSNTTVCSRHFLQEDFEVRHSTGSRVFLKRNAIPKLFLEKCNKTKKRLSETNRDDDVEKTMEAMVDIQSMKSEEQQMTEDPLLVEENDLQMLSDSRNTSSRQDINMVNSIPSTSAMSSIEVEEVQSTTEKRKILHPSNLDDINFETDFDTPQKAERNLALAVSEISILKKEVDNLNELHRRLLKKVKNLSNILKHLRSKNMNNEEVQSTIMENK